jgi:ribosomal protein L11 methyltransferase
MATVWLEVTLTVSGEIAESVAGVLARHTAQGVVFEPVQPIQYPDYDDPDAPTPSPLTEQVYVRGYLAVDEDIESVRQRLEHDLWPLQMIARHAGLDFAPTQYKNTQAADWGESWKQYYKPVRVGKRLVIVPAWEQFALAPSDIPIRIDPGQAFGTGMHPSTQLCLTGIEKYVQPGQKVLDLGCGSGILAIAAAQLGANPIYGYDIDPAAIPATAENAAANGIAPGAILVYKGGLTEALTTAPYDLVLVNILAKVIVMLFEQGLARTLAPNGVMLLAGILGQEQADEVVAAAVTAGMNVIDQIWNGGWVGLVVRFNHS